MTRTLTRPRDAIGADLLQFTGFHESQQQPLHPQRHLADFVEKDTAAVRHLELALLVAVGAGEAPLHVSEELRLEQRFRQAGAVHCDERALRPRAALVNGVRDELFADAALTGDEHLRIGSRNAIDLLRKLLDDGTGPDQPLASFVSHMRFLECTRA